MVAFLALLGVLLSLLPWVIVFMVFSHRRQLADLTRQLERMEREVRALRDRAPGTAEPREIEKPIVSEVHPVAPPATTAPTVPAPVMPAHAARPPILAASRATEPRLHADPTRLEQQIGGIWLQNVGSVLLLLGAFFLIVWGYATRRIGPEILVLSGVLLGVLVAWRGNVIARTVPALGNALIGVGLGTMYITLYVGHFRMGVLPDGAAFSAITIVALSTVAVGLRRKEPIIATLGVLGAFLPQLMAVWIPLQGFRLSLPMLLAYFAVVNAVVFTLAATVGWSGLAILTMLLTSWTWAVTAPAGWSFGIQMGLTALFAGVGLAPVVRLIRVPEPVRNIDLLVVALAPLLLLLCSIPYLLEAGRLHAAWILGGLGVVYVGGAIWVESRRERRDLWKPLTGAATVFLTAAIERGVDPEHLAMAWSAEGVVLIALGLGAGRDAWLRLLGYGVSFLSGCWLTYILFTHWGGAVRALSVGTLRDLFCVIALLVASHLVGRRRDLLNEDERAWIPSASVVLSNLLLMVWIARESDRLRHALPSFAWQDASSAASSLAGVAWVLHSLALVLLGARPGAVVLRHMGYFVGAWGAMGLSIGLASSDAWRPGLPPFTHPAALVTGLGVLLLILMSEILSRGRERLAASERRVPEVTSGVANLILLLWWSREAGHLAAAVDPSGSRSGGGRTLASIFTSALWTLQAITLFAIGWVRSSAFLRWCGLVLFGLTVMKFLAIDLDRVDAFWRFAGAAGIGAALLVVSFLYQRRGRRIAEPGRGAAEAPGVESS